MEKIMFLDYETLRVIWWLIFGFIFTGFAVMGGIDLGVGTLLPFVARDNIEKRIMINSIGATWESNQVWFILGGGATFAAWPYVYAVSFSALYAAMFLVLVALILRPVGFDFRGQIENTKWQAVWDRALFFGGLVPPIVFGVAVGNVLSGLNFSYNNFLYLSNHINVLELFTPFTLLCGFLSLSMMVVQGASFLSMKTKDKVLGRSIKVCHFMPLVTIALFCIGGVMISKMPGYIIESIPGFDLSSNPLIKKVIAAKGGWLFNYIKYPWFKIAPVLGILGSLCVIVFSVLRINFAMFISSSVSIIGIVATVGLSMFPFILPSKLSYNSSLTVWDSSSSYLSLFIMLFAAMIFIPLILFYVSWAYKVMFGRVDSKYIKANDDQLY